MSTPESNIRSLPDIARIETEASEWVMRLQESDVSASDHAAFKGWRDQSLQHADAYNRLVNFWGDLGFMEKLNDYAESDAGADAIGRDRQTRRDSRVRRTFMGAIAASFIGAVFMLGYGYFSQSHEVYSGLYQTAIGRQEVIQLPDGSKVFLNTDSVAEVLYTNDTRKIRLVKGEAYFDVAPNSQRPFSVETIKGTVTAVGTAFSVRVHAEKLDVIVTEGRVALDGGGASSDIDSKGPTQTGSTRNSNVIEVSAGQSAIVGKGVEAVSLVAPDMLKRQLDWRDGELSFNGETLAQVIAEMSRYTDISIEIGDESLREQRIVAYYKIGDVERMFEALNVMANIEVERIGKSHVRLYRAS